MSNDTSNKKNGLISLIATLYYKKHKNQTTIAKELNISTATVHRHLKTALDKKWVSVRLELPNNLGLEAEITDLFHEDIDRKFIKTRVVDISPAKPTPTNLQGAIGSATANFFEEIARNGSAVAIDGGEAISYMIESLQAPLKEIKLFPVAGGPLYNAMTSVPTLIGKFLGRYGADSGLKAHYLPPPTQFDINNVEDRYLKTLDGAMEADITLLGVGSLKGAGSKTVNDLIRDLNINPSSLRNAVGITGYSAFDAEGIPVKSEFDDKVLKIPCSSILANARAPQDKKVILMGGGIEKAQAIRAMLKGGWANGLITDSVTAKAIISEN